MRSGNGRHRRPRQAPALVVAAGVTGSALAMPLLAATSASAADTATWDRVADCESGRVWSADFGNGQYGGLQFTQETWEAYGGTAYAPRADLASRAQQIAVAEKVLADQGPQAWATCSVSAGLTAGGAAADVDPGARADDSPGKGKGKAKGKSKGEKPAKDSATSAAPSFGGSDDSSASFDEPSSDVAEGAMDGAATPAPDASTGKHRGKPAKEGASDAEAGNTDGERESGRHASRGDGSAHGAAVEADGYTVLPGDNLWDIADERKVPGGWHALYKANQGVIGTDPDLIKPGQSLVFGESATANEGSVKVPAPVGESTQDEQ
ncbi:resuscitation-promoting factor protein RpfC [Streptomyces sannanensis]|uniref:Resuscitation-promoting factor protein RpfC n=1 Tax=Streptomyces sannanensis TaxID=285536 RepID=A0ABP6SAV6_9ACTN